MNLPFSVATYKVELDWLMNDVPMQIVDCSMKGTCTRDHLFGNNWNSLIKNEYQI